MKKEFDSTVKKVDLKKVDDNPFRGDVWSDQEINDALAVENKTVEQFRIEIVDALYKKIKKETANSVSFMNRADYFRAKLSEAKIESLHVALGIIIDASTVQVKE